MIRVKQKIGSSRNFLPISGRSTPNRSSDGQLPQDDALSASWPCCKIVAIVEKSEASVRSSGPLLSRTWSACAPTACFQRCALKLPDVPICWPGVLFKLSHLLRSFSKPMPTPSPTSCSSSQVTELSSLVSQSPVWPLRRMCLPRRQVRCLLPPPRSACCLGPQSAVTPGVRPPPLCPGTGSPLAYKAPGVCCSVN